MSKSPQSLAQPNHDQSNPLFCEEVEDTITLSICIAPEPCIEYIASTMFLTSFHLFASASLSIPSGRAGVATAVGNGGGFGRRPVWGIKLCIARGSRASCGFEYWQASDVGPTAKGDKSKQIGQDSVMIGKTRRIYLE